jgi:hypothetical protein
MNFCQQWTPGFLVPSAFGDTARFINCDLFKNNIEGVHARVNELVRQGKLQK